MTDQKMKPSSLAALAVWLPGILVLGFTFFLLFSDMGKYTTVTWRHSPLFRMRLLGFIFASVILNVIGLIGFTRWITLKLGQDAEDLKKANLELQVKD